MTALVIQALKTLGQEVFAGFFKKAIPVVGGVVGGGLTYATFKPCCTKLKNVLEGTYLSNPDYDKKEDIIIDVEDADVEEYEETDSNGK